MERLWFGDELGARTARAVLRPAAGLFGAIVAVRNRLYDAGTLAMHETAIPAIAIGNLTVGGTGKTPMSAWIAARLHADGARPAIVLRGYGDDEPLVHRLLNPDVPVIVGVDRVEGVARAAALGARVAVLDDAFQHRRARRLADVVLVSADRGLAQRSLLPAGPFREPLGSLSRATMVLVTRKAAGAERAAAVAAELARVAGTTPIGIVSLRLGELRRAPTLRLSDDSRTPVDAEAPAAEVRALGSIEGTRVVAIVALGEPQPFLAQLRAAGAEVMSAVFPDHHRYTADDIQRVLATYPGVTSIVCTLKDAVKLGPLWPRAAPALWYVTQAAIIERGASYLDDVLHRAARSDSSQS